MSYQKTSAKEFNSDVGWNQSNLFYIFLNELDMDYRDAYYDDDWNKMYKVFRLKYMKVATFINKLMDKEDENFLEDHDIVKDLMVKFKPGQNDFSNQFNNSIVEEIIEIIENKMRLVDKLMSKAGMNILLEKIKEDRPAALSTDDW